MTVSAVETLLLFLGIFGAMGAARGPEREVWTLGGITLTVLLLFYGGAMIIEQLPVRLLAGVLALMGNQSGSNGIAAHPLAAPWTLAMLWLGTASLIALAYWMGQRFGKNKPKVFSEHAAGFLMGALNGLFIAVFLFNEGGFQVGLHIQFPDGLLTRTIIAPVIMVGVIITVITLFARKNPAKTAP